MLVLSGRHLHEPTTLDLVQLIVNVNSHNRSLDEGMSDEEDLG